MSKSSLAVAGRRLFAAAVGTFALAVIAVADAAQAQDASHPWGGFYVGANAGYGWGSDRERISGDTPLSGGGNLLLNIAFANLIKGGPGGPYSQTPDAGGLLAGGQAGYNWRLSKLLVAGIEGDLQYSAIDGDATTTGKVITDHVVDFTSEQKLKWLGTVRGRLGYLVTDGLMLFGTAGLAYGRTQVTGSATIDLPLSINLGTSMACPGSAVPCMAGSDSKTSVGLVLGGGFELALSRAVTLKAEYLHIDLGDQKVHSVTTTGTAFISSRFDNAYDIVRSGVNVKF